MENYQAKEKYTYKVKVGKGKRAKLVTKTGIRTVTKQRCKVVIASFKGLPVRVGFSKKKKRVTKKAKPRAVGRKTLRPTVTSLKREKKKAKKKAKTPRKTKVSKPSKKCRGVPCGSTKKKPRVIKKPLTKNKKNGKIKKQPKKNKLVAKPQICQNKKGKVVKCLASQKAGAKLEIPKITPRLRIGNNLSILYDRIKSLIGNAFNNFKNSFGKAQTEEQQVNSKAQRASDQLSDFLSGVRRDIEKCTLGNFFENTNCAINSESFKNALGTLGNILANFFGGFMEGALEAFSWQNLLTTLVTALITGGNGIIFQVIGAIIGVVGVASNLTGIVQGATDFANADIFTKFKTIGKIAGTVSVGAVLGGLANNLAGSINKIASGLRKVKVPPAKTPAVKCVSESNIFFWEVSASACVVPKSSGLKDTLKNIKNHAYDKHVVKQQEFPTIQSPIQFMFKAKDVIANANNKKILTGGRTAFYDSISNTLVIINLSNPSKSTMFKPSAGINYYNLLK